MIKKRAEFYDKNKESILQKYTGIRDMQVLRALATGKVKPADLKCFNISGKGGYPPSDTYMAIKHIPRKDYNIEFYGDVSNRSKLQKLELSIENGKGTIIEYWGI